MSSLTINPKWNSEINQVENGEPITGGVLGNANLASRQLGENIFYLKQKTENDLLTKANKADVYTKTETDGKYAQKATTISGYNITDAYTKIQIDNKFAEVDSKFGNLNTLKTTDKTQLVKSINEVFDNTKGVVDLYNKNVEAGAGANGWTALLVQDASGKTQQEINNATIQSVETITDLLAIQDPAHKRVVNVKRFSSQSQYVGGQLYTFDATNRDADNGFETLAVSGMNGRWKANFANNVINVHNVGYIADGTTDNSNIHQKVSAFLNAQTKSFEIVFSDGIFLFNQEYNRFWLTSNTKYTIKPTATIKGGAAFDDDVVWFASQFDPNKPLRNVVISGGGTFDMSDTGMMATAYYSRVMFYLYHPINVLIDGCIFKGGDLSQTIVVGERENLETSRDVIIKNNKFYIQVTDNPLSKNYDFTCIYVLGRNVVVRNNNFIADNIRAKCISTAIEFHTDDGVFDNNTLDTLAVGAYIAQQEHTSSNNIKVTNNKGLLSNLFIGFWTDTNNTATPEVRTAHDILISGNDIKQWIYPDRDTLKANGLIEKDEGLRFLAFINSVGMTGKNLYSNGINVVNNTFTHVNKNVQCSLLHLFANMPDNININNNTLKVAALFTTEGYADNGIKYLNLSKNVIDGSVLSSVTSPLSLNVASIYKCVFDLSDIQYTDILKRDISLVSFASVDVNCTLTTIKEGKKSWNIYNQSIYPTTFYSPAYANTSEIVFKTPIVMASTQAAGAFICYTDTSSFKRCTKAEILYCGEHLDANLILPSVFTKRNGDASAFVALGYTGSAQNQRNTDAYLYIS
jgi:hypothetical protein